MSRLLACSLCQQNLGLRHTTEAEAILRARLDQPNLTPDILDAVVRALGRCGGNPDTIHALEALRRDRQRPLRTRLMAAEAIRRSLDSKGRQAFADKHIGILPAPLRGPALDGSADDFQDVLIQALKNPKARRAVLASIATLYLIDSKRLRPAIIHIAETFPLEMPWVAALGQLFEASAYRRDARLFGILAYRLQPSPERRDDLLPPSVVARLPDAAKVQHIFDDCAHYEDARTYVRMATMLCLAVGAEDDITVRPFPRRLFDRHHSRWQQVPRGVRYLREHAQNRGVLAFAEVL